MTHRGPSRSVICRGRESNPQETDLQSVTLAALSPRHLGSRIQGNGIEALEPDGSSNRFVASHAAHVFPAHWKGLNVVSKRFRRPFAMDIPQFSRWGRRPDG